ncbi:MAG: hypothetical protein JJU33_09720 [Phycisphaerales bacterium]|nr:hypothetical protein [Phycisphaerales bacterium]
MGRTLLIHRVLEDPIEAIELENLVDFDALKARLERNDLPLVEPEYYSRLRLVHRAYIPQWKHDAPNRASAVQKPPHRGYHAAIGLIFLGIASACLYAATIFGSFDPFDTLSIFMYLISLIGISFIAISILLRFKTSISVEDNNTVTVSYLKGKKQIGSLSIDGADTGLLIARAAFPGTLKGTIDYRYLLVLLAKGVPIALLASHSSLARILRVKDEAPEPLRSRTLYALEHLHLKVRCRSHGRHHRTGPIARGVARVSGLSVPNKAAAPPQNPR